MWPTVVFKYNIAQKCKKVKHKLAHHSLQTREPVVSVEKEHLPCLHHLSVSGRVWSTGSRRSCLQCQHGPPYSHIDWWYKTLPWKNRSRQNFKFIFYLNLLNEGDDLTQMLICHIQSSTLLVYTLFTLKPVPRCNQY